MGPHKETAGCAGIGHRVTLWLPWGIIGSVMELEMDVLPLVAMVMVMVMAMVKAMVKEMVLYLAGSQSTESSPRI